MSILSAPKNLTRNVLIGMALGVLIASLFHYHLNSSALFIFVEKYLFNLGGQVFKNLLMLVVVPLVFFSLVSDFISFQHGKVRINCN